MVSWKHLKRLVVLGSISVLALALIWEMTASAPLPKYNGHSIAYWFDELAGSRARG